MRPLHVIGWAPLPTLIVAWAMLAQVLSFRGVAIWVGTCSLLVLLVMRALLGARRDPAGLIAGVTMTLAFAYLADTLGGDTSGPLARATLLSCGLTAAATALAFTRHSLLLLVPSLALIGSALALGAAGHVAAWIGLWAVAAALTAAMLGPYRKHDLNAPGRLVPFALLIAGTGFAAVAFLVIATPLLRVPWTIPGAGPAAAGAARQVAADPTLSTADPVTVTADSAAIASPPVDVSAPPESAAASVTSTIFPWVLIALVVVLLLFVLFVLWLLTGRLMSWIRWRSLRWRLSRGTPEQRVVGAWTYLRLRLIGCGHPLPASASPDVAAASSTSTRDSPLADVARLAAQVAFNPEGTMSSTDAVLAWKKALKADRAHRRRRS